MNEILNINDLDTFICDYVNENVILLYFGAKWCKPCVELINILKNDETKKSMPKLKIAYIDIENHSDNIADMYEIKLLPTQIFIKLDCNDKIIQYSKIEGYDLIKLKLEYDEYLKN
jgi:thiol-disulfide isomerase/thioredoxin